MMEDQGAAWSAAAQRYASVSAPFALFNVTLLAALRFRWEKRLQPVTSMTQIWFVRPEETYPFSEWVAVGYEAADRVRVSLHRSVTRSSLRSSGGTVTVTGDFARPENAVPLVESFLEQLPKEQC